MKVDIDIIKICRIIFENESDEKLLKMGTLLLLLGVGTYGYVGINRMISREKQEVTK